MEEEYSFCLEITTQVDNDTLVLLRVAAFCLKKYFRHSNDAAIRLIEAYYFKRPRPADQIGTEKDWVEWLHHDGPFELACHIEYETIDHKESYFEWRYTHTRYLNTTVPMRHFLIKLRQSWYESK